MKHRPLLVLLLIAVGTTLLSAQGALALDRAGTSAVVWVQTNEVSGNHVVVYERSPDGTLRRAGTYATGGDGGAATPGTESDRLASQGSLAYDVDERLLIAVNAGSDSVSAFRVHGDRLELANVVSSGGQFPASVAVHGDLAYVLNAGGTGNVQGFRVNHGGLRPIDGSSRTLGLANDNPPFFLTSPGQIGFSPDGEQLIVTTKASGSTIDVFAVGTDGRLSAAPTANASATPVPFAFTFAPSGRLVVGEAGASAVSTYALRPDGTLADAKSQSDGQVALCWIQRVGDFYYVSNTGSNTLSAYTLEGDGQPALVTATSIAATTEPGPIDLTSPPGSDLLYAETGTTGTIDEFRVNDDGSLTSLGTVTGLPPGIEGIASS